MPTRAQAEDILVGPLPDRGQGRCGGYLARVGFKAAGASPVVSLSDALSIALSACAVTVADIANPTDADFSRLPNANWPKFLDIAELRLLEVAVATLSTAPTLQMWRDYQIQRQLVSLPQVLADKRKQVASMWGYGASRLTPGTIKVDSVNACENEF